MARRRKGKLKGHGSAVSPYNYARWLAPHVGLRDTLAHLLCWVGVPPAEIYATLWPSDTRKQNSNRVLGSHVCNSFNAQLLCHMLNAVQNGMEEYKGKMITLTFKDKPNPFK